MRTLNVKLFLILAGATVLTGAVVFTVHYFQAERIAQALLWQARRQESENEPKKAAGFLNRYLEFQPRDAAVRAELATVLADPMVASTPKARDRALFALEQAVTRDASRVDLRRLIVSLGMQMRPPRLKQVKAHLDTLEKALPDDAEIAFQRAAYYEADREADADGKLAAAAYRKAIAKTPQRIEAYEHLANVMRIRLKQPAQADAIMDALVKANGASPRAYLTRAQYRMKYAAGARAGEDIAKAQSLQPNNADVIVAAGDLAQTQKKYKDARDCFERGIKLHPSDSRFYLGLAQVAIAENQPGEAIKALQQGAAVLRGKPLTEVLWDLANVYLDEKQDHLAEGVISQLQKANGIPTAVSYLQARSAMVQEDWGKAASQFERTRLELEATPGASTSLLARTDLFLGECYDHLSEPTRQLEAFSRALQRDPTSELARLGVASALRALGRPGAAIEQFRTLTSTPQTKPDRWIELARLRLEDLLRNGQSSWKEIEYALDNASKIQPKHPDVILLRAQVLVAQKRELQAQKLLEEAWADSPKQPLFPAALAELALRQNDGSSAVALLDRAEKQIGARIELVLARMAFWAKRPAKEAAPELAKLDQRIKDFGDDDQARLLQGLAEASLSLRLTHEAENYWHRLAEKPRFRKDLRLHLLLFDLAMQAGDDTRMNEAIQTIQAIEGTTGTLARYASALRLIRRAGKDGQPEMLNQARTLLDGVAAQRRTWTPVILAKAEVERLSGHTDQAIALYRRAKEIGERSARNLRPLVQLLYESHRYDEADQTIRDLRRLQRDESSKDLTRILADIRLQKRDPAEALKIARETVNENSRDYHDFLWLGKMLAASDSRSRDAEIKLRRAVELADTVPETWVALVQFLAGADRKTEARTEIARAAGRINPDVRPLALAECYEAVGEMSKAKTYYEQARSAKPSDVQVLRAVAGFYLRQAKPREAEPILRTVYEKKVKASANDLAWARRGLALVLVADPAFGSYQEALKLVGLAFDANAGKIIETGPPVRDDHDEEQRARARVLAAGKMRALRVRAMSMLEELASRQALVGDDHYLLVQLYENDKAWTKAYSHLQAIIQQQGPQPLYEAHYIQSLLYQKQFQAAEPRLAELEKQERDQKLAPGTLGTIDLRVLDFRMREQHDRAIALLESRARRPEATPQDLLAVITYLGHEKHLPQALERCKEGWTKLRPEVMAGVSVNILKNNTPSARQYASVESAIRAALQKQPDAVGLLLPLAELENLRGQYTEALDLYGRVLQKNRGNPIALNNRAWLLAFRSDKPAEALNDIDMAIRNAGPTPEFLDTRAVVHLALKQHQKAIADLEQAMRLDKPTWYRYFHLARAQLMADNKNAALAAFRRAKDLGLERELLPPVERDRCVAAFDELERR